MVAFKFFSFNFPEDSSNNRVEKGYWRSVASGKSVKLLYLNFYVFYTILFSFQYREFEIS